MQPTDPMPAKDYEQLVQQAINIRGGQDAGKQKGPLYYIFETQGGATAMTVLIGGIFAALINSCIQKNLTDRQAAQSRLGAKYSVQLEVQKDRIKERSASNKDLVELIGQVVSHTQNLATTHGPLYQFDPKRHQESDREKLRKQVSDIRKTFNETNTVWNKQKDAFQYKLALLYGGNKEISVAWTKLATAIDAYLEWVSVLEFRPAEYLDYSKKESDIRGMMQELSVNLSAAAENEVQLIR